MLLCPSEKVANFTEHSEKESRARPAVGQVCDPVSGGLSRAAGSEESEVQAGTGPDPE